MLRVLEGGVTFPRGFKAAGVHCGIKRKKRDLAVILCTEGAKPAAGAFTTNLVKAAPVEVTIKHLRDGVLGCVVINSGVANCYTGERGYKDALKMAELAAELAGLKVTDVAVGSTGVIGKPLPVEKVEKGIREAFKKLSNTPEAGLEAAEAITTTDTRVKQVAVEVTLEDGTRVRIGGMAKGAGMIAPKLKVPRATMIAVLTTDVNASSKVLARYLAGAVEESFNMLTVDGDTSTNDMVLLLSSGLAGNRKLTVRSGSKAFKEALEVACVELAKQIAMDGEGSSKYVEVEVKGAKTVKEAKCAAKAVASSILVKCAIYGCDLNWGRILAALGYSGARFDPYKISIAVEGGGDTVEVVKNGKPLVKPGDKGASAVMRNRAVKLIIDLNVGNCSAKAFGCDMTERYVKLNALYTT